MKIIEFLRSSNIHFLHTKNKSLKQLHRIKAVHLFNILQILIKICWIQWFMQRICLKYKENGWKIVFLCDFKFLILFYLNIEILWILLHKIVFINNLLIFFNFSLSDIQRKKHALYSNVYVVFFSHQLNQRSTYGIISHNIVISKNIFNCRSLG